MKEIKTLDIPLDEIEDSPFYARRFEELDKEDIKQLAKSFERSGLLQPIIVRENVGVGKKYQLIAGARRKKAFQLIGKDRISAKIVEADDIEARIMSLAENYHRKDLDVYEKEKSIYKLWISGNEKGMFQYNLSIMEEWTGIPHQILSDIINAEKEKEKDDSEEIQFSTSKDLQRTRGIKDIPEVRKELLKGAVIKKAVKILDVADAVKIFRNIIGELPQDILVDIAKLFTEKKIKVSYLEDFINLIIILDDIKDKKKVIKKIKKDVEDEDQKIDILKFKNFIDIYIESFDDVKEGLLNHNIDIDEAKHLNLFKTRVQREKILKDLRDYDKEIKYIEDEKIKYIKERKKLADSDSNKDEEERRTRLVRVGEEEDKIINRIFKIRKDLLFFGAEDVENYDIEVRNKAIEMIWEVYNHYHEILIELGELDTEEDENVDIKKDIDKDEEDNIDIYFDKDEKDDEEENIEIIDDNQILRIKK